MHAEPQPFTTELRTHPVASPLARSRRRGDLVANRKHESVPLEYLDQQVLQLLDGTRDLPQLVDSLVAAAIQGRLTVRENQQPITNPEHLKQALNGILPQSLVRLAGRALLIG